MSLSKRKNGSPLNQAVRLMQLGANLSRGRLPNGQLPLWWLGSNAEVRQSLSEFSHAVPLIPYLAVALGSQKGASA